MSTLFTKIINGEIPSYTIAEDKNYYAFLDIRPVAAGHTLVIPRVEVDYIFDLPDDVLGGMLNFAKPIARAIDRATGCIRTGIIVEGLEVPHAHIHLIPIMPDRPGFSLKHGKPMNPDEMEAIAQKIRAELKREA